MESKRIVANYDHCQHSSLYKSWFTNGTVYCAYCQYLRTEAATLRRRSGWYPHRPGRGRHD